MFDKSVQAVNGLVQACKAIDEKLAQAYTAVNYTSTAFLFAKFEIFMSELNVLAFDKLSIVIVAAVLELLVPNFDVSESSVMEFLNVFNELTTSARLDI